jgi:tagatose-1,6-bisphosphate aldolase
MKNEIEEQPTYYADGMVFDSWYAMNAYCKANAPAIQVGSLITYNRTLRDGTFYETIAVMVKEVLESRWYGEGKGSVQGYFDFCYLYKLSKHPNFKITNSAK